MKAKNALVEDISELKLPESTVRHLQQNYFVSSAIEVLFNLFRCNVCCLEFSYQICIVFSDLVHLLE